MKARVDEADALVERFKDLDTSDDTASVAALLKKLPTPPGTAPAPKAKAAAAKPAAAKTVPPTPRTHAILMVLKAGETGIRHF